MSTEEGVHFQQKKLESQLWFPLQISFLLTKKVNFGKRLTCMDTKHAMHVTPLEIKS